MFYRYNDDEINAVLPKGKIESTIVYAKRGEEQQNNDDEKEGRDTMTDRYLLWQEDSITDVLMDMVAGLFLDVFQIETPENSMPQENVTKTVHSPEMEFHDGLLRDTAQKLRSSCSCQLDTIAEAEEKDDCDNKDESEVIRQESSTSYTQFLDSFYMQQKKAQKQNGDEKPIDIYSGAYSFDESSGGGRYGRIVEKDVSPSNNCSANGLSLSAMFCNSF